MRISTNQINTQAVNSLVNQQTKLSMIQNQLATGKRVITPSDNPIAAAKSITLSEAISTTEQYQVNADVVSSRLNLEESSIERMIAVLNRVRELALQGNNAPTSDADRLIIATEMTSRLDELLALSNTRDANGEYIYSGFQGFTQPFSRDADGGFTYSGDDGQRLIQVGPSRTIVIGDSGRDVFLEILNGNGDFFVSVSTTNTGTGVIDRGALSNGSEWSKDTYTINFISNTSYEIRDSSATLIATENFVKDSIISFSGVSTRIKGTPLSGDSFIISPSVNQDMFTTINNIINAFGKPTGGKGGMSFMNNSVNRFLSDVDQALNNVHDIRAGIGSRLNSIDSQKELNEVQIVNNKKNISELIDIDFVKTISDLNMQKIGLESAQKSYIKIQGLSLFNYL